MHIQTEQVTDTAWTQARPQIMTVEQWARTKICMKQAIQDKHEGSAQKKAD